MQTQQMSLGFGTDISTPFFSNSVFLPVRQTHYRHNKKELVLIAIWVDDGLVCSNNNQVIKDILSYLSEHFEMRSAPAGVFVGLEIIRNRLEKKLFICQPQYIRKLLQKFNMMDAKPKSLPADPNARLMSSVGSEKHQNSNFPYREAVGSLLYLTTTTRPDISFAVGQTAQYCEKPEESHWNAVKRIFRI